MALGHVPLADLLADMIRERARQTPAIAFPFAAGKLKPSYGDAIDLTIYRCVQEGLTNAIRHAQATTIRVNLDEARGGETSATRIELAIEDDGRGIDPQKPSGFGLRGMQERVRALGGECTLETAAGGGTRVRVVIPLSTDNES
jgi:two-component system sensor histidine kinase UhpB